VVITTDTTTTNTTDRGDTTHDNEIDAEVVHLEHASTLTRNDPLVLVKTGMVSDGGVLNHAILGSGFVLSFSGFWLW